MDQLRDRADCVVDRRRMPSRGKGSAAPREIHSAHRQVFRRVAEAALSSINNQEGAVCQVEGSAAAPPKQAPHPEEIYQRGLEHL